MDTRQELISTLTKTLDHSSLLSSTELGLYVKQFIPSGLPSLDLALGIPGIPCGRITTIRGKPAAGKSSLVCQLLGACQKVGGISVLIDSEYAYDPIRSQVIGMDVDSTIVLQPDSLEESFNQIEKTIEIIRKEDPDVPVMIAIDSVAGLPTAAEAKASFGDSMSWGSHARIVSLALRRIVHKVADQKVALLFVNQTKDRTDVAWGDSDTMIADNPISFHSTLILKTTRVGTLGDPNPKGIQSSIRVSKNKLAPPLREVKLDVLFYSGIDVGRSYGQAAIQLGYAKKKGGGWIDVDGKSIKEPEFKQYLIDNNLLEEFDKTVREHLERSPQKLGGNSEE
jgi:recombination protein RecA